MKALILSILIAASAPGIYAQETPMLAELETALETLIQEKLDLFDHDVEIKGRNRSQNLSRPKVAIAATGGTFKPVTQVAFKQEVQVTAYLEFEDLTDEAARHKGAYPMVEGLVGYLTGQRLGLEITPLQPIRWDDVTDPEADEAGRSCYLLTFRTTTTVHAIDDEQLVQISKMVLGYPLKPGDDIADSSSQITYPTT